MLAAWDVARREGEELVVAGLRGPDREGVRYAGTLEPDEYRALLRRARVYVTAPRREDYGIAQLEALADGARVVTTAAPGPYAALALLRRDGLGWVAPTDAEALGAAIRAALDDPRDDAVYAERALDAIAPFRRAAVDAIVREQLLPRLLA